MRILCTGGAGFICSHVVDALIEQGHHVAIQDNLSTGFKKNLNPKAVFYNYDIRLIDPTRAILQTEQPEVVIHHAAQMDVRKSVVDPAFDADVNILGSLNVLTLAQKYGCRKFVHISSGGAVYGEPLANPVSEVDPVHPLCPYGITKHTFEHYLYVWEKLYGMEYVVLRYPNVYGPRQNPYGEAGVTAIFANKMLRGEPVTINGDGEQVRDYVYVSDIVQANILALRDDVKNVILNVGSNHGTSVNSIFANLADMIGYTQQPFYGPAKLGETRKIWLDNTRITRLGWKQEVNLYYGLRSLVDHLEKEIEHESA